MLWSGPGCGVDDIWSRATASQTTLPSYRNCNYNLYKYSSEIIRSGDSFDSLSWSSNFSIPSSSTGQNSIVLSHVDLVPDQLSSSFYTSARRYRRKNHCRIRPHRCCGLRRLQISAPRRPDVIDHLHPRTPHYVAKIRQS